MANEYGGKNAETPETTNGSRLVRSPGMEAANAPLKVGSSDIDDAIQMHLVDCDQCRYVTENGRPVPNIPRIGAGQDGHCGDYWQLQLMRAKYEGAANNIVAYTEFGDEAPKGVDLE